MGSEELERMEPPEPPPSIKNDRDNGDRRFYELWNAVWESRLQFTKSLGKIDGKWNRLDGQMKIILSLILGLYAALIGGAVGMVMYLK